MTIIAFPQLPVIKLQDWLSRATYSLADEAVYSTCISAMSGALNVWQLICEWIPLSNIHF